MSPETTNWRDERRQIRHIAVAALTWFRKDQSGRWRMTATATVRKQLREITRLSGELLPRAEE